MAEHRAQDVVNQTLSVGDLSPSDAPATTSTPDNKFSGDEIGIVEVALRENGVHTVSTLKMDEFDDASVRSDTDTSRAEGSVAGDKSAEQKPLKKFVAKPVSFAKYSVPKVVAAGAAAKGADKAAPANSSNPSLALVGRPRLVAKTTSSLQSKAKPFKSATPDPMQVWNKNRITPQPSTKHLTDEELKQQYGIHLTSRIQEDGDGKEAKWADIDDDEDDWAPETIEWNDGTKSTLTPADVIPQPILEKLPSTDAKEESMPAPPLKALPPQFTSSVGPNATVLKLGASAERQLAQKAAILQSRGPMERPTLTTTSKGAPAPSKSPWAILPPVDKASPVSINPQPSVPPPHRFPPNGLYSQSPSSATAPSPAKEISADDFNRSWRDSLPGQPRELYMPNSGKYETVPEGRRRMSRNDQNFRAATVLQRPGQSDPHGPAEPSAAFQTHRTSTDSARRRASSTISGSSGQFARRMSIKSSEHVTPVFETQPLSREVEARPASGDGPPSQVQTPTYQARGMNEYVSASGQPGANNDIEEQRVQQKLLMKEKVELARKRKIEEEQALEAKKQESIKKLLTSLPDFISKKPDENLRDNNVKKDGEEATVPLTNTLTSTLSPPKPPQPLASGEPQQYGMMKVHPMDSVKKLGNPISRSMDSHKPTVQTKAEPLGSKEPQENLAQGPSPIVNGVRTVPELRRTSGQDVVNAPEASPKFVKPNSVGNDALRGWNDLRHDHRSPQTGNLWGLPTLNNKALGNGTFDSSLAGYAPQDLSRTSSTAHGWMNGRTPHAGRSPQTQHVNHVLPDNRSYSFQSVTSPDQGPLAIDSEVDSLFPTTKPAPIGPPQAQSAHQSTNGHQTSSQPTGVNAWNNFQGVANQQERAESERVQREIATRRDEELRSGVRQGPQYNFNETWKQVHAGDQAGQRQLTNVSQATVPASNVFGAVGSISSPDLGPRVLAGQPGRGSRFFPQHPSGHQPPQDRRAVTYSHPEPPRTPSPPPAEEYASFHPAFDGGLDRPVVHFPKEKAVVKLPPAMPPTPPSPVDPQVAQIPDQQLPLSWAARVSMPPPAPPAAALRAVSTPIVQNPSWQERFNGLLGRKTSPAKEAASSAGPALAVASSTKEPLDVQHALIPAASVSLPFHVIVKDDWTAEEELIITKDVESEDDLFEDREPGSLPTITFPREASLPQWAPASPSRILPLPVEAVSAASFMASNLFEVKKPDQQKPLFAIIRLPGSERSVKKDIPIKGVAPGTRSRFGSGPPSTSGSYTSKNLRHRGNPKSRQTSKAH